jgi:phage repressor protein C with HTH and peptisase S24 domain
MCIGTMVEHPPLKSPAAEIFARLDALGVPQTRLAEVLDLQDNKISNVRRGVRKFQYAEAQAAIAWLDQMEADLTGGRSVSVANDTENTVEVGKLDMSLAMGDGTNIEDYVEETGWRFDIDFIRSFTRTPPHRIKIATGVGDSMFPTILSSDAIFFDTTQTRLNLQDKIWACSIRGGGAIKRLRIGPNRKIIVLSDNPAVPDDEVDEDELRIFGRVLRLMRDI